MILGGYIKDFKLTYGIEIHSHSPWRLGFNPYIHIWFLKVYQFANGKDKHYRGINWDYSFFDHWVILMKRKTFKLFNKYIHIDYPIKIYSYDR